MKGIVICLLATAFTLDLTHSLKCYFCYEPTASKDCSEEKNCSAQGLFCKTTVSSGSTSYPFTGNELVVRDCSYTCRNTNPDAIGEDRPVFCCTTDLCNNRGLYAAGNLATVPRSYGLLVLSISLVGVLLR